MLRSLEKVGTAEGESVDGGVPQLEVFEFVFKVAVVELDFRLMLRRSLFFLFAIAISRNFL